MDGVDETNNFPSNHLASINHGEFNDETDINEADIDEEDIDESLPNVAAYGEPHWWCQCPDCDDKLRMFYEDIDTAKFKCDNCGSIFDYNDNEIIWHDVFRNLKI